MPNSAKIARRLKSRSAAALERVRHARHPLRGWRKWSIITLQALTGAIVLFALANLTLSLSNQTGDDWGRRAVHEAKGLWFSAFDGQESGAGAFEAIYGDTLGREPDSDDIFTYFEARLARRSILLDQVMVERIQTLNGRFDARAFPPGVYAGLRALGPDTPPWVVATKYPAHFLFFPRHAYILVVPDSGEAQVFSASLTAHFSDDATARDRLAARLAPYRPGAYDYPASGQAIHELRLITRDPMEVEDALVRLSATRDQLSEADVLYNVLAPNSNTVIGCILERSGVMTARERADVILALRAPGFGARCPIDG